MVHGLEQIQKPRQRGVQSEKSPFRGFNESLKNLEMAEGSRSRTYLGVADTPYRV